MYNIMQIQKHLESMSPDQLQQYATNPTSLVPQWAALSEINARREQAAAMAQANAPQGPQPTVLQQMVGQPQQLAGLPAMQPPQAQEEFSAAEGGIVGYAQGGLTREEEAADLAKELRAREQGGDFSSRSLRGNDMSKLTRVEKLKADLEKYGLSGLPGLAEEESKHKNVTNEEKKPEKKEEKKENKPNELKNPVKRREPEAAAAAAPMAEDDLARYQKMMGEDPNIGQTRTGLEALQQKSDAHASEATNRGLLAAAGAGFRNTSQFFGPGLGDAIAAYAASKGESDKQSMSMAEKMIEARSRVGAGQRAEHTAGVAHGLGAEAARVNAAAEERRSARTDATHRYTADKVAESRMGVQELRNEGRTPTGVDVKALSEQRKVLKDMYEQVSFGRLPPKEKAAKLAHIESQLEMIAQALAGGNPAAPSAPQSTGGEIRNVNGRKTFVP